MVIAYKTTRYRCPYCDKSGANKKRMQEHANDCIKDENTKACATCSADQSFWLRSDSGSLTRENGCAKGAREYGKTLVKRCPHWQAKGE
ncbi:hypothetical protein [Azospirillum sp.]|uniref:hypothetical protein n=1 Tax=Azospirillum sp. TaxID=34012 RepID=UPI003D70FD8B